MGHQKLSSEQQRRIRTLLTNNPPLSLRQIAKQIGVSAQTVSNYAKAMKLLNMENYKNGITSVAIHFDDPVPQWVIPYINYQEIIQNNLNSFPLESIGIQKVSNDFITTSNIVSL